MANERTGDIRSVALVGPAHAGKTTFLETLLEKKGVLSKRGSVAQGNSQVDYDELERAKKHTLFLKVFHAAHKKRELQILDSPGYPDFLGEALAAMNAVETVTLVIGAPDGVTFHARRLFQEAGEAGRARVVLVNRCDAENVDLEQVVTQVRELLGSNCWPAQWPDEAGAKMTAVRSILDTDSPWKEQLVESLVSLDDEIMEAYLESGEIERSKLGDLLRRGIREGSFVPILFAAGERDVGVEEWMDFMAEYAPSPLDGPFFQAIPGTDGEGEPVPVDPSERSEFLARVFRTQADPFVGRLSFVRVLAGEIAADGQYLNPRIGKVEKVTNLLRPQGKEQEKIDRAVAGEIVVLAKVESLETNDTLCDEKAPAVVPPMKMPAPMVALAITPKSRGDEQKLSTALRKLCAEDPTLETDRDTQTGELIVRGISPLHLETQLERLRTHFKVDVETKIPRVPMRETISGKAEGHHRHKKQTGGRGQFAEVFLRVRPLERGQGFSFVDETFGGSIPKNFLPAVEKGIVEQMEKGVVAGYPVVDVEVVVYDGKHHEVDSDEYSFKLAGARAFVDAFRKAQPVLLEPIVNLEVAVPSRFMGDINSDLTSRRGRITGMEAVGDVQIIKAQVPLKEVQTYAADLRSITQGEGSYSFEFSHYDLVPSHVAQELIKAYEEGRKEEE